MALFFIIRSDEPDAEVFAYISSKGKASSSNYDIRTKIPHDVNTKFINVTEETIDEMRHTFFVPQSTVEDCGVGTYYLTIEVPGWFLFQYFLYCIIQLGTGSHSASLKSRW